jgi:hypothetical protein
VQRAARRKQQPTKQPATRLTEALAAVQLTFQPTEHPINQPTEEIKQDARSKRKQQPNAPAAAQPAEGSGAAAESRLPKKRPAAAKAVRLSTCGMPFELPTISLCQEECQVRLFLETCAVAEHVQWWVLMISACYLGGCAVCRVLQYVVVFAGAWLQEGAASGGSLLPDHHLAVTDCNCCNCLVLTVTDLWCAVCRCQAAGRRSSAGISYLLCSWQAPACYNLVVICYLQVPGCRKELLPEGPYYQRRCVCKEHATAEEVPFKGLVCRCAVRGSSGTVLRFFGGLLACVKQVQAGGHDPLLRPSLEGVYKFPTLAAIVLCGGAAV